MCGGGTGPQISPDPAGDSSESEPEELARFTPQALDQPAKAVKRSLAKVKTQTATVGCRHLPPAAASTDKVAACAQGEEPGVLYIGHIPHGFYEDQMRGFFNQFGEVSKLRLSRNKKTGRSRHFAFVEFADRRVAGIVAETMNNYLLCNKILVCKVVDAEKLHKNTWVGANRKFQKVPWRSIARKKHNQERTAVQQRRRQEKLVKKEEKKRDKLKELGIEYAFDGYVQDLPKQAQKTTF